MGISPPSDAVGELIFHNRYSYAGANPVNRVDPSGMCWVNDSALPEQQSQCYDAWLEYTNIITDTYTQSWPRDIQILVTQEAKSWGNLSYSEFVSQWNNPSNSGNNLQSAGSVMIVQGATLAMADSLLPGPADIPGWLWAIAGLCVVGLAGVLTNSSTTIAIPQRPQYDFARKSGPRITWQQGYQAAKVAGACVACQTAKIINPKFCNVNIDPGEGCPGCHIHVFRFHQDANCFCSVVPDKPRVRCLANPYAGPSGGPYFPLITPIPTANPELAICTGGWIQT